MLTVVFSFRTRLVDFLRCHAEALALFGGVPHTLVYDNLKSVVLHRREAEVTFNPKFLPFADRYGFRPRATWPGEPHEKGLVERPIDPAVWRHNLRRKVGFNLLAVCGTALGGGLLVHVTDELLRGGTNGVVHAALPIQWRKNMKLSAPKQITWWIAVVVGVVGILASLITIPVLSGLSFWLVVIAFALLAIATLVEGL